MTTNDPNTRPVSRPAAITALAIVVCILGLGQAFCAGFMPAVNWIGILPGAILILLGITIWFAKGLWRKESLNAYLYFLAGVLFLIVALNGAFGLGIAQYKVPLFFVWAFVAVGLVFFLVGYFFLKKRPRA
jgi:predicted membrane channel-forming protein YqfA (hemolysin III family)